MLSWIIQAGVETSAVPTGDVIHYLSIGINPKLSQDSLLAVQREREAAEVELKSTTGKVRQIQTKLATIKTEMDSLISEREKHKGNAQCRQSNEGGAHMP